MNQIILADEHTIFLAGAARILSLEDDMQIVAQCDEYSQLLTEVESFRGAIVIVSLAMVADILTLLDRIQSSDSRVILITENSDNLPHNLADYVDGRIQRDTSGADLISCVRRASQGRSSVLKEKIAALNASESAGTHAYSRLTPKEMQIVVLIGQGCKNKDIATQLDTTEQVIKNYLRSIFVKVGVSDRLELAVFTFRQRTSAGVTNKVGHLPEEPASSNASASPTNTSYVDRRIRRITSGADVVSCVRRASQGQRSALGDKIAALDTPDSAGVHACSLLTPKEMQIVALISQGYKNKDIATQLHTKEQSIKNYLRSIFVKVGVTDRLELAVFTFHHRTLAEATDKVGHLLQEPASNLSPSLQVTRPRTAA